MLWLGRFKGRAERYGRYSSRWIIGLTLLIAVVFTGCIGLDDINDILYETFPDIAGGLMILFFYMAWRNYLMEDSSFGITILWSVLAVIVSFGDYDVRDMAIRCGVFLIMTAPVYVISIGHPCFQRLIKNRSLASLADILLFLSLAFCIFTITGGDLTVDYYIVAMWLAESILWSMALHGGKNGDGENGYGQRRRKLRTWIGCLTLFYVFTIVAHIQVVTWTGVYCNYWNRALYLCCPLLLPALAGWLLNPRPGCRQGHMSVEMQGHESGRAPKTCWKICTIYVAAVALLVWNDTVLQFSGLPELRYSPDRLVYFLILANVVFWMELFPEIKQTVSRGKAMLWGAAVNVAAMGWIVSANIRMFSRDLSLFDRLYGKEGYGDAVSGRNLISVTNDLGYWPLAVMTVLLLTVIVLLWNRRGGSALAERMMKYLAAGYGIRMVLSVLAAGLGILPMTTFPFTKYSVIDWIILTMAVLETEGSPEGGRK